MMDLFESIYVDDSFCAYINITQKRLYINDFSYQFDFIITKIFFIKHENIYLGCEFGVLKFNYKTLKHQYIYKYQKDNFRSNDGAYIDGKFYLGYMSKDYDLNLNCTSSEGFIVEFADKVSIIERSIGIPNYMGMYKNEFIYVDSKTRTLNKLGNRKMIEFKDVVDGGFRFSDSLYLCCYDANIIVKCDLSAMQYNKFLDTTDIPTSCCLHKNTIYYTSSKGLSIKKEIKL